MSASQRGTLGRFDGLLAGMSGALTVSPREQCRRPSRRHATRMPDDPIDQFGGWSSHAGIARRIASILASRPMGRVPSGQRTDTLLRSVGLQPSLVHLKGAPIRAKIRLACLALAVLGQWKQDVKGPDGKVETIHVRSSEILKKVGGKTLYVVDHASIGVPRPPAGAGAPPAAP